MALSGLAHEWLIDFSLVTGLAHLNVERPINLAGYRRYDWMRAAEKRREVAGGSGFNFSFKVKGNDSFTGIRPGGYRQPKRVENILVGTQRWFRYIASVSILDDEIEKNLELRSYVAAGARELFWDQLLALKLSRRDDGVISMVNGIEDVWGAAPNFTQMEDRTLAAEAAYSYFAIVNEDFAGLYGYFDTSTTNGAAVGGPWTSKFNVSKATIEANGAKLRPLKVGYGSLAVDNEANIINALKRAIRLSTYEKPPSIPQGDGNFRVIPDTEDLVIKTSDKGYTHFDNQVLASQDLWTSASREDPAVMNPMVRGYEVQYWPILDNVPIYDGATHATKVREGAATCDYEGPRFYGHRRASLYPVNHDVNWFRAREMPRHVNVPDLSVEYMDTDLNFFCEDLRGQFVVTPTTVDLYGGSGYAAP